MIGSTGAERVPVEETTTMNITRHDDNPWQEWRDGVMTRVWSGAISGATAASGGEQLFAPGTGAPRHWHYYEEHITVLSGVAEFCVGDEVAIVEAPATLVFSPMQPHSFTNIGDQPLHILGFHPYPISHSMMEDDPTGTVTQSWEAGSDFRRRRLVESGAAI